MTRKDFELIAEALRSAKPIPPTGAELAVVGARTHQWKATCNSVTWALTDSNPAFDRKRFLKACGLED